MRKEGILKHLTIALLLPLLVFLPAQAQSFQQEPAPPPVKEDPKPLPPDHVLAIVDGLDADIRDLLIQPYLQLFEIASSVSEETRGKLSAASEGLKRAIEDAKLEKKVAIEMIKSERELLGKELERITKEPNPTADSVAKDGQRITKEINKRRNKLEKIERKITEVERKTERENRDKQRGKLLDKRQKLYAARAGLENEVTVLKSRLAALDEYSEGEWQKQKKEQQHLLRCRIQSLDGALVQKIESLVRKRIAYQHADAKIDLLVNWPADEREYLGAISRNTISELLEFSDFENIGFRTLHGKGWRSDLKAQQKSVKNGDKIYEELEKMREIKEVVDDPVVQNYIQDIRDLIVRNSDIKAGIPIKVVVVNDDGINAFAFPGYFFITKGLLLALENEAQLVAISAHEIAHIAALHIDRGNKAANKRGWLLQGGLLALLIAAQLIGIPAWLFSAGYYGLPFLKVLIIADLLRISREFEEEADILGAQYTFKAGYDPRAFTTTFDRFSRLSKHDPQAQSWFATHPSYYSRMRNGYAEWLYLRSVDPDKASAPKTNSKRFNDIQERLRAWNDEFKKQHPEKYRPVLNPGPPQEEGCQDTNAQKSESAVAPRII